MFGANLFLLYISLFGSTLHDSADLYAMGVFLGLGMHAWWRRGLFWGALVLIPVFMPMATGSLMSLARLALAAYPGFIDASELAPLGRITFATYVGTCVVAQVILVDRYVNWGFVG